MEIHTSCGVCGYGMSIEEGYYCNICKKYIHKACFDDEAGMCNDCSKELD